MNFCFSFLQGWSDIFASQASYKDHYWDQHQLSHKLKEDEREQAKRLNAKTKHTNAAQRAADWKKTEQGKAGHPMPTKRRDRQVSSSIHFIYFAILKIYSPALG